MSERMASRSARRRVLEEVSSRGPGSKSATPVNGVSCRPSFHDTFFRGTIISRVQRVDEVTAGKGRSAITAKLFDVDDSMIARKRDSGVICSWERSEWVEESKTKLWCHVILGTTA